MRNAQLEQAFPSLSNCGYCITSPKTPQYNCIAWAAGKNDRWWWPTRFAFWPEEPRELSLDSFVRVFRTMGYEVCDSSEFEAGFEKVVIYVKNSFPTHMARQLPNGEWTSKCGTLEDMSHTLEGLASSDYGEVATVMKRQRV